MNTREKPRISLVYHSGVGGTKLAAELTGELLSAECDVRVRGIYDADAGALIGTSELLVFCFPTYYLKPSRSMAEFIASLPVFGSGRRAYLIATAELYTENCIRTCARALERKGIVTVGSAVIHAPGTDVTCLVPARFCRWLYRFEKGFPQKLLSAAGEISSLARTEHLRERIPAFKWYTPFSQLLQILFLNRFDRWKERIRVIPDRCSGCGLCVRECGRGAWERDGDRVRHLSERCELCTGCIHRCPRKAIVLLDVLKDNPRLDRALYARLKAEARERLPLPAESPLIPNRR